jgi:hypothetical protein
MGSSKFDTQNRKILLDGTSDVKDSLVTYRDKSIPIMIDIDIEYNTPSMMFYARKRHR